MPHQRKLESVCQLGEVKNEFQFLCYCSVYKDIRRAFYRGYHGWMNEYEKLEFCFRKGTFKKKHHCVHLNCNLTLGLSFFYAMVFTLFRMMRCINH